MLDRRAFLAAAGTGLGTAFLAARREDVEASFRAARARPALEVLTPEQAADIAAVSAQIIPTDDLPGAREAGVANFVDKSLATWAAPQKQPLLDMLAQFNAAVARHYAPSQRFSQLTADQQLEFLRANEGLPFFQQMMGLTTIGTIGHPDLGGNANKVGWQILGFVDAYVWQPPFGWYDDKANGGPN